MKVSFKSATNNTAVLISASLYYNVTNAPNNFLQNYLHMNVLSHCHE